MLNILFVCLGNICRSPMAEAILKQKARQSGYKINCDSAGMASYHIGESPDNRTLSVLTANNISFDHHARKVTLDDTRLFEYILAMDHSNLNDLKNLSGETHSLFLMRNFDPLGKDQDVPDPYYGSIEDFKNVYTILDRSISGFLTWLEKKEEL